MKGKPVPIDPQRFYCGWEVGIAMPQFVGGFGSKFCAADENEYLPDEEVNMHVRW